MQHHFNLRRGLINKLMRDSRRILVQAKATREDGFLALANQLAKAGMAKLAKADKLSRYA